MRNPVTHANSRSFACLASTAWQDGGTNPAKNARQSGILKVVFKDGDLIGFDATTLGGEIHSIAPPLLRF